MSLSKKCILSMSRNDENIGVRGRGRPPVPNGILSFLRVCGRGRRRRLEGGPAGRRAFSVCAPADDEADLAYARRFGMFSGAFALENITFLKREFRFWKT